MIKIENHCVDCGLPCLGRSCPYLNVQVTYCDECETGYADYRIDEKDLCRECAEKYLQNVFDDLTVLEKAAALEVAMETI